MVKNYLLDMKTKCLDRLQPQKGQSIIIVTFAFLGLLAMLGLALDLGLVYIERVRISRTTDAATLASVVELPFEEEAMRRAIEYIELNGYDVGGDTEIRVRGCVEVPGGSLANVDGPGDLVLGDGDTVQPRPGDLFDGYTYIGAAENPPRAIFVIDTLAYQPFDVIDGIIKTHNEDNCIPDSLYGTANKIRVAGRVNVDMNFMQFFGFGEVPVSDRAVGENVTNLDVVVVFDVSGSMDFETTCFDCWEPDGSDVLQNPWPANGNFNPLPNIISSGKERDKICTQNPDPVLGTDGSKYFVHEAEHYSRDVPNQGWQFERRVAGQGFWVIQRMNNRGASGTDGRGSYIRAHPFTTYSQSDINNNPQLQGAAYNNECFNGAGGLSGACWQAKATILGESVPPSTPPYVEYDFTPDWGGNTHIWIRAQGSGNYGHEWNGQSPGENLNPYRNLPEYRKAIFWQVGRVHVDLAVVPPVWELTNLSVVDGGTFNNLDQSGDRRGPQDHNDSPSKDAPPDKNEIGAWRWLKLGSVSTTSGVQHTLRLYQGNPGFQVDKIIFTNFAGGSANTAIEKDGDVRGSSSGITNDFKSIVNQDGGKGPAATDGSGTREACNICNPVFGDTVDPSECSCKTNSGDTTASPYGAGGAGLGCTQVLTGTNNLNNDLFHDKDPIRSAKEAVKNFAVRLDPKFDQIGFVAYSTDIYNGAKRTELQCIKDATINENNVRKCYDPKVPKVISFTEVIKSVELHDNDGGTDIGEGMREGLEELGIETPNNQNIDSDCDPGINDKSVCDRQGAARRILVLMTDGSPNSHDNCPANNLWNGTVGQGDRPYDCSIYYAQQAANNNVTVYTIGIGSGVNFDLLTAMATGTDPTTGDIYFSGRGGQYYPAAKPSDLDRIFDTILSNVFVRIVG